ncbi:MAG: hypothetical protein KF730_08870 [Sphingomonas sp.]|uniref:hypothetical protein n=1 Tax=Sphingomonas sp. TaxID=28214 RepID=UPI0025EC5B93|nr:hypothetical protein [Sphingomonas sp.]MBX3564673.1 hypothetical protein [Sphingomonas sp.]
MNDLYLKTMRSASKLLFWIAVIVVVGSLVARLAMQFDERGGMMSANQLSLWELATTFVGAIGTAVWPLFGAALLWRLDRWQPAKEISE